APMPEGIEDGIIHGLYPFRKTEVKKGMHEVTLLGSGSILMEVLKAQEMLAKDYDVAADVWNVTSYTELRREALEVERWNMLHPMEKPRVPYIVNQLGVKGPIIAASDWMKILADQIVRWVPNLYALGTDGFGRSDSRVALRKYFEVDAASIVVASLSQLMKHGKIEPKTVQKAIEALGVNPEKQSQTLF
ncbi:MAG: pyruvate dehydrogenase (acetyl-transferring), homodimeric type, partial [Deltaproteobacteria bacterium]|nr:pyruvate dehydrogenase (acetyl-transferring), homodimeric type [Deltaproteobacteria bacterium]